MPGWLFRGKRVPALRRQLIRPLTVCYHAASETWQHKLSLPPSTIERQVAGFVRRGFTPARAEHVVGGHGRLLHVTFDDAFASTSTTIAALASRGIATTVFVCTGLADRDGAELNLPELDEELRAHPNELATLPWAELKGLATEYDVEIGSHTVSHPRLWELSDGELRRELSESKTRVEDQIRRPCRYLAYPFGQADERTIAGARSAGYEAAFLLANGRWRDRHALPRMDLYPSHRGVRLLLKSEPVLSAPILAMLRLRRSLSESTSDRPS